jgi:hypothetical protein
MGMATGITQCCKGMPSTWHPLAARLCVSVSYSETHLALLLPPPTPHPHPTPPAGGAKVLEGIGKGLRLRQEHLDPSYAVLRDYGNVSSSSTWYTLAHVETVTGVKKGDKVMQVGWAR